MYCLYPNQSINQSINQTIDMIRFAHLNNQSSERHVNKHRQLLKCKIERAVPSKLKDYLPKKNYNINFQRYNHKMKACFRAEPFQLHTSIGNGCQWLVVLLRFPRVPVLPVEISHVKIDINNKYDTRC